MVLLRSSFGVSLALLVLSFLDIEVDSKKARRSCVDIAATEKMNH